MGANAQTSVPKFVASQILTDTEMTQINTGIPVFSSSTTRDAAFGGTGEKVLAEGQFAYLEDTNVTQYYDGSAWQTVGPTPQTIRADYIATSQSSVSTSYTDLSTVGPTVTVTTGTTAYVMIQTLASSTVANRQFTSFAVTGASSISAGTYEIAPIEIPTGGGVSQPLVASFVVTGLTAGSNTFTMKYKSSDGNAITWAKRYIQVITV
jgi:hypothetical protein